MLYSFSHITKKIQDFIRSKGGGWARRANINIPDTFADVQILGDELNFGLGFNGTGGANFSSQLWMGGVGDMLVSKYALNNAAVTEYYASTDFSTLSYYDSQVWAWLRPGTYPSIIDVKGNVAAGSLAGGQPSDFKNVAE